MDSQNRVPQRVTGFLDFLNSDALVDQKFSTCDVAGAVTECTRQLTLLKALRMWNFHPFVDSLEDKKKYQQRKGVKNGQRRDSVWRWNHAYLLALVGTVQSILKTDYKGAISATIDHLSIIRSNATRLSAVQLDRIYNHYLSKKGRWFLSRDIRAAQKFLLKLGYGGLQLVTDDSEVKLQLVRGADATLFFALENQTSNFMLALDHSIPDGLPLIRNKCIVFGDHKLTPDLDGIAYRGGVDVLQNYQGLSEWVLRTVSLTSPTP